jgi:peptidoglycan/LPS O-acetylase OafA/YrhL
MALLTLAGGLASATVVIANWQVPWHLASFGIYLTLGMLLYWAVRQRYQMWMFAVGVAALMAMVILTPEERERARSIKGLIAVVIMIFLARGYRTPKWFVFRALSYIGARSYSFYLMHAIVGYRVFTFVAVPAIGGRGDWIAFPLLAVALALTFVVSLLFFKYVEAPCREMARRVQFRSAASGLAGTRPSTAALVPSPPSPHPVG